MQSLYQPISVWVIGHGLQLLHAKDLAHFLNHTTHEVSTSVTQEPGWGPKDNACFMKWSWNTKTLATLGDWFGSKVVSVLVKSTCRRPRGAVAMMGCKGALGKLPSCCRQCVQVLMAYCIWLVISGHQKCSCSKDKVQSQP